MLQKWIDRGVAYCIRYSKLVIAAAILLAALSAIYTARHFAIDTDINNLISERLPWRQNEIAFQRAFPQTVELILVDVAADLPEAAKAAAREVAQALAKRPDLFRSVRISSIVRSSAATACCFFRPIRWRMSPNS